MRRASLIALLAALALPACGSAQSASLRIEMTERAQERADEVEFFHVTVHPQTVACDTLMAEAENATSFSPCEFLGEDTPTCFLSRARPGSQATVKGGKRGVLLPNLSEGSVRILVAAFSRGSSLLAAGCGSTKIKSGQVQELTIELDVETDAPPDNSEM